MKKLLLLLATIVLPLTCFSEPRLRPETWAVPVIDTHLKNLNHIDDQIYRSEQPDDEDVADLKSLGIREIINLREYHDDRAEFANADFLLHRVKINTSRITEDDIVQALSFIRDRKGPILIHCWHGSDRTGVIVASYRILFNHWSKSDAIDEMAHGGFGYHERVYPELVDLVRSLDVDKIRSRLKI